MDTAAEEGGGTAMDDSDATDKGSASYPGIVVKGQVLVEGMAQVNSTFPPRQSYTIEDKG